MRGRHFLRLGVLGAALTCAAAATASSNHGKVGDTLTVKGQEKDVIAVTVLKTQDPATGYTVDAGKRIIGVIFKVKNVGKVSYDDFPTALVTTAEGESSASAIATGGTCDSPGGIRLKPGQSRSFCLPFEIAKKGRVVVIQYEPDGGYGTPAVFAARK